MTPPLNDTELWIVILYLIMNEAMHDETISYSKASPDVIVMLYVPGAT